MLIEANLWQQSVSYALRKITAALRGQITLTENMLAVEVNLTTPASAGTTFTVSHNLGRIPRVWIANPQAQATFWTVNLSSWTDSEIYLACSGSSISTQIVVMF